MPWGLAWASPLVAQCAAQLGLGLVGIQLGAIGNKYGYTFNGFKHEVGVWCHPITLINCCDEVSANYPYFGPNEYRQNVNLINFNIEHYPTMFSKGGDYAREAVPGQWGGNIDYDIQDWEYNITNSPNRRFWAADSSGVNVKSRNNAQASSYTADELRWIAPNINQIVFNSTAGKPVMCRRAGDYASARVTFSSVNTKPGDIEIKVGWTYRKVNLPKVFSSTQEMADYIYRHLFYSTSCRIAPADSSAIDVWSCRMGDTPANADNLQLRTGDTGVKAEITLLSRGADNLWIDLNGNKM